ncbi:hypothetical protein ANANG_G00262800 [Anguilla anguilla]|uniref:DNA repair protein SWI5 homolog n=1 Tax=Anguilla anguilla TaxID=7936 RepID=A0A9D3LQN3_ANGAN|nr:hypothetical protein ANANG_G00262800 [Anguilla anguilla]
MDSEDNQKFDSNNVTTNARLKSTPNKRGGGNILPVRGALRTPYSGSKRVHSSFKSPLQAPRTSCCPTAVQPSLEQEIEDLKRKQSELDYEITQLENNGVGIQELEQHVDLLHEYNDIKDIGQTLLGRLAAIRGVTTRDLYTRFGLELDD